MDRSMNINRKRDRHIVDYLNNHFYCKLGISKVHGIGVFALRDIPAGIDPFVLPKKDRLVTVYKASLKNLDENIKEWLAEKFINDDKVQTILLTDTLQKQFKYYFNHNEKPNLEWNTPKHRHPCMPPCPKCGGQNFITLQDIKKDEEIFVNYAIDTNIYN